MSDFDIAIIGSGAGGSTAFVEFSHNKSVILIEEGVYDANAISNLSISESLSLLYRDSGVRPALGSPSVAIGEGKCLGGSTEINGGLFWRPTERILDYWSDNGLSYVKSPMFREIFEELEHELGVKTEELSGLENQDSKILLDACLKEGLRIVPAQRAVTECKRRNLCPSGCPSGAKKTMSRTLIEKGKNANGQTLTGWRVIEIIPRKANVKLILKSSDEKTDCKLKSVTANEIILSCGSIESRRLLQQSKIIKQKLGQISFHANLKIVAEFSKSIKSERGTIFTHQLQHFIDDGFLLMASNFNKHYFSLAATTMSVKDYIDYQAKMDNLAIYTLQFKPITKLMDLQILKDHFQLFVHFKKDDIFLFKKYLSLTSKLLFESGAKSLKLPFYNAPIVSNYEDARRQIDTVKRSKFSISTVHLMSSIPLPSQINKKPIIDKWGRLLVDPRIRVLDASILPSNIGESPQGTIMAIVRLLIRDETILGNL